MLQIKTIYKQSPSEFDKEVNEALAEGWTLTCRTFDPHGFLAELEKHTITKDEKCCENCRHYDKKEVEEPCFSCRAGELWEAAK